MVKLIKDDDLLEKYNTIWADTAQKWSQKFSADINKEFESEPGYNKKCLKTKLKSCSEEVTCFHDKKIPNVDSNHACLAVISLDSALNKDGNYYPQVFFKECKYILKKLITLINDDLGDFSYSDEFDEE